MATHSSVLAWRIPGTGKPGGLPSMGSHRVGHDWSDLAAAAYVYLYTINHTCVNLTGMAPQECFPASNKHNLWKIDKFTDLPGFLGFPGGTSGKEPSCQCRRCGVRSLGWEDPLEEAMATHSRILAWSIPWTEEPGGLQSMGSQRVRHDWSDLARCTPEFPPWLHLWKTKSHNPPPALSTLRFLCCN